MYVCLCTGTTDRHIKQAVAKGARSVEELQHQLGVASQCGECSILAQEILCQSIEELHGSPLFHEAV